MQGEIQTTEESPSQKGLKHFFEPPPKVIGSYLKKIYIYIKFEKYSKIHFQLGNKIK